MRLRLLLISVVLLGVAACDYATKADVKVVDDRLTEHDRLLTIWADSIVMYLASTHDAICAIKKPGTTLPDPKRFSCKGGGTEDVPPPKYPPR